MIIIIIKSYPFKRKLQKYLEKFSKNAPPLGRIGPQKHHHLVDKTGSLSHTALCYKAAGEKVGEEHDRLFAYSINTDLESCSEVLLHQKIQAARQRDDKHAYTARKAGNLQQSRHRAWPLIRTVGFYKRQNFTTWNGPKYILVTLFAFLSIYITLWFSKYSKQLLSNSLVHQSYKIQLNQGRLEIHTLWYIKCFE